MPTKNTHPPPSDSLMNSPQSLPATLLYLTIRLLPLFSAFAFLDLSNISFERSALVTDRLLRAFTVLLLWSATEGVLMLWVRERNTGSQKTRGYGAVACILGVLVLVLLQAFRSQSSQSQFLILLAALATRGMSRSAWEQGRPTIGAITAPISHSLISVLSFMVALDVLSWQALVLAVAVGVFTGSVDITRRASSFRGEYPRWLLPLYRLSISFPAVAVSSLSLIRQLPSSYIVTLAFILLSTRFTWNGGKGSEISSNRLGYLCGLYVLFVILVVGALVCSQYIVEAT